MYFTNNEIHELLIHIVILYVFTNPFTLTKHLVEQNQTKHKT